MLSLSDQLGSCSQMPDLMHLTISESKLLLPALSDHGAVGAGPGFILGGCSSGSASVGGLGLCAAGSFGPPRGTADLRAQMETSSSSFASASGPAGGLQDFSVLPAPAQLDPLENTMEDLQNLVDPQNQQPVKYDLLSNIPRESAPRCLVRRHMLDGPFRVPVGLLVLVPL